MSKAQNRHDTLKWKKKRKDHDGDKCHRADCGICHPDKKYGKEKPKYKALDDYKRKRHGL